MLSNEFCTVTSLHTPLKKVVETNPDWRTNLSAAKQHAYDEISEAEIFVATHADGVRANSRAVVETMREFYGVQFERDRLAVLAHGMEDRSQRVPALPTKNSFTDVLYTGRFEGRKGTDVLLEAIPGICRTHRTTRFILVGEDRALPDGSTLGGTFRTRFRGAQFLNRVIFAGEVSDSQLESYLSQCDVFVAPSRYESFGLVFLEAMMFGKPVVGCRSGGMTEVIEDGVTGLLAEPGDAVSLAAALDALLEDADKRREFGRAARDRYLRLYTRESLAERTLAFYRKTLERKSEGWGQRVNSSQVSMPGIVGVR
jgi:glycogen(starch) synthase